MVLFPMTLNDLEWFGEIFNDTKHRAASLRRLSFLWHRCIESERVLFDFWVNQSVNKSVFVCTREKPIKTEQCNRKEQQKIGNLKYRYMNIKFSVVMPGTANLATPHCRVLPLDVFNDMMPEPLSVMMHCPDRFVLYTVKLHGYRVAYTHRRRKSIARLDNYRYQRNRSEPYIIFF